MSLFSIGSEYRGIYRIEQVVPFFNGELAIASANGKRFYLQASLLHREAPARALQQYRNLQHPLVLPYIDVFVDGTYMVFVRPYVHLRPLREVIVSQEISEQQVVEWGRQLLELEASLRSKPLPMYLLLDPRNIGIDPEGKLQVMFCGLEHMMNVKSGLDWGTFFYSIFSGQYLDGPILKLPKDFAGSKALAKLIQKTIRVYDVDLVLEQINQYQKKKESGSLLKRFLGERKTEPSSPVLEQTFEREPSPSSAEERNADEELYRELEELLQSNPARGESNSEIKIQQERAEEWDKWEELDRLLKEESQENEGISEASIEEEADPKEAEKDEKALEEEPVELEVNSRTVTISPALRALEKIDAGDLSNSFVISLERERKEFELRRQERLEQLRREFEQREKEFIEQKQREFAELEQKLLEEQRKKLEEEEQQILLKEQQILEQEWRQRMQQKKKERMRRKILEQIRKQWEEEEQALLQKEREAFLKREQELIAKLTEEFERKKEELLKRQREEFEKRMQQKIEALHKEWKEKEKLLVEEEEFDQHHIVLPERIPDEEQGSFSIGDVEIVEVIALEEETSERQEEDLTKSNESSSSLSADPIPDDEFSCPASRQPEEERKQTAKNEQLRKNENATDEIPSNGSDEQEKLAKQFEEYMNFFYKKS